jgi:hypothetical protein
MLSTDIYSTGGRHSRGDSRLVPRRGIPAMNGDHLPPTRRHFTAAEAAGVAHPIASARPSNVIEGRLDFSRRSLVAPAAWSIASMSGAA